MLTARYPLHVHALLRQPATIMDKVQRAVDTGLVEEAPNAWQLCLGVLRMTQRLLFRWESVGTAPKLPVRDNWRARLFQFRPARLPFLVRENLIHPFDLTGLIATPEQIRAHVMGAYHAGDEFIYDLQLLSLYPGELEKLRDEVHALLLHDTPRHRFLQDLNAYEGYHETLREAVDHAIEFGVHAPEVDHDPDWSLAGYLNWCAKQPASMADTWALQQAGRFDLETGMHPLPRAGDELLDELLVLGPSALRERLSSGHAIDPTALDGKVYRGVSLGLPSVVDRLAWKTFQKAFQVDPQSGHLMGWNVRMQQTGFAPPAKPVLRKGEPLRFGHFRVRPVEDQTMPAGSDRGLLIDYSEPAKKPTDPMRWLRDPIVALNPDDPSTLLGWSYLDLGHRQMSTPSFFLLSHPREIDSATA